MKALRTLHGSERGQVLPLAAISLLAMAAMVFISLNVSWTVHNRIRLQNYADAKAYSTAVQVARTYNYFAYSNRALANAYVSMATLHAYMSEAAAMSSVEFGFMEGFGEIAAEEQALADACFAAWDIEGGIEHEIHSFEAGLNALGYMISWLDGSIGNRIQGIDSSYKKAFDALDKEVTVIWKTQQLLFQNTRTVYLLPNENPSGIASGTDKLRENNMKAPNASTGVSVDDKFPALGALNALAYAKPIDQGSSNANNKQIMMTNVVNATRPPFTWDRNGIGAVATPMSVLFPLLGPIKDDCWIDSDELHIVLEQVPNTAWVAAGGRTFAGNKRASANMLGGIISWDMDNDVAADRISSDDWINVNFQWKHGVAEAATPSFIPNAPLTVGQLTTGTDSDHTGSAIYSFDFDIFNNPCDGTDHSHTFNFDHFTNYKINNKAPYNQPSLYAAASADLKLGDSGQSRPWEINGNPLKLAVGSGSNTVGRNGKENATGVGNLTLSDNGGGGGVRGNGKAVAVSKSMVYYHRFGDWREEPNFFNPYWRAKLEPWDSVAELGEAIGAADISGGGNPGQQAAVGAFLPLGKGALNIK